MSDAGTARITSLLSRWKDGDRAVENQLATLIYPVLRDLARAQVRRNGEMTMRPTELVHEAYSKIADQKDVDWQNRQHFYAIAATVLRRVLIDYLRQRSSEKRGGEISFIALDHPDSTDLPVPGNFIDWLALDQALTQFALSDPDAARVVELRLFSGLSVEEIATISGTSTATVGRQWRFARAWLATQLDLGAVASDGS